MTYENKAITNRGFIRGPFCTIYGLGALSVYFLLQPISQHYVAIFICGMVMATLLEIVTAKIMTRLFGGFWWNYDNKRFNYHGVICLQSSLCWGVMSLCTFIVFQPMVEAIVDTYYLYCGKLVAVSVLLLYILDFATSFRRAIRSNANNEEELELDELDDQVTFAEIH
jgi:uncharacterized membrane protein